VFAGAPDAQCLHDVPQGIERLSHVRRLRETARRRPTASTRARSIRAAGQGAGAPGRSG
jgi:hypothetical protein